MKRGEATYQAHETTEHLIQSSFIAQTFRIKVLQPISRTDGSERFPVVYVTDSDEFFGGLATLSSSLQGCGEIPRFILVGIGYEDSRAAGKLRWRDFVTHATRALYREELQKIANSPLFGDEDDLAAVTQTTDAGEFLYFIREELMPFITSHYPALPDDNNYYGYSLGGTFGLYVLSTRPDTFRRYVLGSPGITCDGHHYGVELAKAFIRAYPAIYVKMFLSVGELEEFGRGLGKFDLVTGYYLLAKFLRETASPGLDLTARVFPDETHATAWTLAFSHGLKTVFGPADQVPFWPE
jgi:predicted alpha/beta superfamily hydrolase